MMGTPSNVALKGEIRCNQNRIDIVGNERGIQGVSENQFYSFKLFQDPDIALYGSF